MAVLPSLFYPRRALGHGSGRRGGRARRVKRVRSAVSRRRYLAELAGAFRDI